MKKNLLSTVIGVISIVSLTIAQSGIPNAGFEIWSGDSPQDWGTLNTIASGSTSQTTDANSGSSAALLETKNVMFLGDVPGVLISNGQFNFQTYSVTGGFQYTLKPAQLSGSFKSMPASADSTSVLIWLTKWNGSSRDTIAYGSIALETINTYTQKNVILTYVQNPPDPDTAMIIIASTKQLPPATIPAGGKIYVDDLAFTGGNVGFQEINSALFTQFYPNPVSTQITFNISNKNADKIFIYDITGKNIATVKISEQFTAISTAEFSEGIYFYQVKTKTGENISTAKFIVKY